jgi:hypothetical protein
MRFLRFSIADLVRAVLLCAVGLACLMFASTPWGGSVYSVTLGILTLAPLLIIYRRGDRRAFWTGVGLCGWAYMIFSFGPWFVDHVRPKLITSRGLEWAYPWLIPPSRQAANPRFALRPYDLPTASLEGGLTIEQLNGSPVDVWSKGERDASPSLLVTGAATENQNSQRANVIAAAVLLVDADQFQKLAWAKAYSRDFILRPHTPSPLDAIWLIPPVGASDFEDVGHAFFGLVAAWIGGLAGRLFLATGGRDAETIRRSEPTATEGA